MTKRRIDRRRLLLEGAALAAGGAGLAGLYRAVTGRGVLPAAAAGERVASPYGPLRPVADPTTGLDLLRLPEGFRYFTCGWTGDPLDDGGATPAAHDGMAAFAGPEGRVVLVRNHEVSTEFGAFSEAAPTYDPGAGGGTTTLTLDLEAEALVASRASLAGTLRNCAGGPTPWGSWLSCEEHLGEPRSGGAERPHGFVFEVPSDGEATGAPLEAMGRFNHEAVAIDPEAGLAYLTEDQGQSGLYRFRPEEAGDLAAGGSLEMLAVVDRPRLDTARGGVRPGEPLPVTWVPIADPTRRDHRPGDGAGCFAQGLRQGGAVFSRGEGAWLADGQLVFTATNGGAAFQGQLWSYDPAAETLTLRYESPGAEVMTGPDNVTLSPRGGVLVCQDGGRELLALTPDGDLWPLVGNGVVLRGERGFSGDYRGRELTGVCFDPTGRWLFFNAQVPGITFCVTGPWGRGPL